MSEWHVLFFAGVAALIAGLAYNIFLEVRSIRRMMNHDRSISERQDDDHGR